MEIITDEKIEVTPESTAVPYVGKPERTFLDILSKVNQAVDIFANRYEWRHDVKILDVDLENEAIVGCYYVAGVIKLNFTCQRNQDRRPFCSSVILKIPELGSFREDGEYLFLYQKERFVYEEIIPQLYSSWTRKRIVPEFYGSTDANILVLENLKQTGFYQNPLGSVLDLSSSMVVLKALAQFHALSIPHVDRFRTNLESLTLENRKNCNFLTLFFTRMVEKLRRIVLPLCSKRLRDAFDKYWRERAVVDMVAQSPKMNGFNVILHGDSHYYNLLFKNDHENKVSECKLIDFQHTRCGPPILDVMKFIVSSVDFEVFDKNYHTLFSCYVNELDQILNEFHIATSFPYGLSEILEDFEKYKFCFLFDLIFLIPIFWTGRREFDSMSDVNDLDEMLSSTRYISYFKGWSKFLLVNETI